jgi:hypothetical protein
MEAMMRLMMMICLIFFIQLNPVKAETEKKTQKAIVAMEGLTHFGEILDIKLVVSKAKVRALRAGRTEASGVQSALRTYFVQKELNSMGFPVGEPDGISGNNTRTAISSYASSNNISQTFDAVFLNLYRRHIQNQTVVENSNLPQAMKEAISSMFNDPYSTRFSNVTVRKLSSGLKIYCGSVNAKNAYGAYVGAMRFFAPEHDYKDGLVDVGQAGDFADLLCHFKQ